MSRYICVESFMQDFEEVLTWDIIAALNSEEDADVVSREQFNLVMEENLQLKILLKKMEDDLK